MEDAFLQITQLVSDDRDRVLTVEPQCDIVDVIDLALKNNTDTMGFYIVDLTKIFDAHSEWTKLMPRVEPYYAVKCNPNKIILKIMKILGIGFDCASINEMIDARECGGDDAKIIYANPAKSDCDLKYARTNDIDLTTFDCKEDLLRFKAFHDKAKLILRIKVDDSSAVCQFNSKFGAKMSEIEEIFKMAQFLALNIVGVSFHVGSGCRDVKAYSAAIANCREVFNVAATYGFQMNILDIGGGFPGTNPNLFAEIAYEVQEALDEHFPPDCNVDIIAEPGRYFVAASHTLVLSILKKKQTVDDETGSTIFEYTLPDGVYGSFNCKVFDHAHPTILPFNERDGTTYRCRVFGPTCDSMDTISDHCELPDLLPGEWVYIENFGAYTTAAASNFNGFAKIPCKYILRCD